MGRNSGAEYRTLSEEDDDEDATYLPVNGTASPFSPVPLQEEDDDAGAEDGVSDTMAEAEGAEREGSEGSEDFWTSQTGLSWLLVLVVRHLFLGKRSILVLVIFSVVGLALFITALVVYPIKLETSLSSFQIPDHIVYTREDAFETATGSALSTHSTKFTGRRKKRETSVYRGYTGQDDTISQYYERRNEKWKINLVYRTVDGSNILQHKHIKRIHEVERQIENHTRYTEFCWLDWSTSLLGQPYPPPLQDCYPLNSLMTYFYPPTGRGSGMAYGGDVMTVVRNAWSSPDFFWYLDSGFSEKNPTSKLMRAQLILGYPLHGVQKSEQQHQAAKDFIVGFIPLFASLSNNEIQVLYGSPDIYDYQVLEAAYSDIRLSIIAVSVIAVFVFILTSFSPFLTFICLEAVAMSLPLAYFVYRVFAGVGTFGLLNILSLFVLTGIGVDDCFMFINTFRQAPEWMHKDVGIRLHYTLLTAGKATLFTSATTAAAFFANLASGIPAVHNFGLFMGLVVVMCYITVLVQMPAALYIWQRYLSCQLPCCACWRSHMREPRTHGQDMELMSVAPTGGLLAENGDEITSNCSRACSTSSTSVTEASSPKTRWVLTDSLANVIKRFIAQPVIKCRYVVIVLFIVLFSVSVSLVTRLRTAEKPPQFFPSGSNLQQFIDLTYNTSQVNVDCSKCSGFFHTSPSVPITNPPSTPAVHTLPRTTPAHIFPTFIPETHPVEQHTAAPTQNYRTTTQQQVPHTTLVTRAASTKRPPPTTAARPATHKVVSHTTRSQGGGSSNIPTQPPKPPVHVNPVTHPPVTVHTVDKCSVPGSCEATQPSLTNTANVYVVFGISGIIRNHSSLQHVSTGSSNKDTVVYDPNFARAFSLTGIDQNAKDILCKICLAVIEPHRGLVLQQDGAWECVPSTLRSFLPRSSSGACSDPRLYRPGDAVSAQAGINTTNVNWLAMGFKSNVFQGGSSFKARDEYQKWEKFMEEVHRNYSNPAIQSSYQTSEFWKQVFLEVVAVTSALYSIALSALLCLIFVAVFTGCPLLTAVTLSTVGCIACVVLACFYLLGWHLGAVEAISMSILIGTAVDYCVHLVEGYLVARRHIQDMPSVRGKPWLVRVRSHVDQACKRALWSLSHVGLSIVSSALTTLFASLPLCFAEIQLLARFGQIMFINTLASILLTSTACCALLCCQPQWRFPGTWRASVGGALSAAAICGALFLILYLVHVSSGVSIPAPDGSNLF